ncbi:Nucleoside-diphosphate-sugar epimerase [Paramicrobacterium humi]|uniref:Nucleoside-diphosphate-sugar epimerase n=1 Tax=Paramicrobacterium humi TaxID=640635 RepID=A0A1H4TA99_9MICO|nr:SDR family oxidoreductase [Microbacterium humi]SEC53247.1 Nucleoside-diphosphate-sugar epimerase [Microbacterium humi]
MAQDNRVVIIGGHGKVALLAAPELVNAGFTVSSLIRNPEHSDDVSAAGAQPVVLDIENADVDALAHEFSGAAAIVFSAGAGGGNPARTRAVDFDAATRSMRAAAQAGVPRFVMVSYARAGVDIDSLDERNSFYAYAQAKHDADAELRATDLDYTILGPGRLTLDAATGRIQLADASGDVPDQGFADDEKVTSRGNVAQVIAHVLAHDAAIRETVNFYDGATPIADAIR